MQDSAPHSGLDWLYSTQLYGIKLGLDNVHRLLSELGLPGIGQKIIHVAGTNGKGSTCAFMHAILREAGISAGLFTSPHLIRFNERIRDHEREITDAEIEAGLSKLSALVAHWEPHPTFFELALVLALDWFQQRGVEWIILETGLGGRLDATNALQPEVCIITRIGLDHQAQLGETLEAIAGEKAGIIKLGIPVITCPQEPAALAVIHRICAEKNAPLTVVEAPLTEVSLGLAGRHQAWNAALALAALSETGLRLPAVIKQAGLSGVQWPGRFQRCEEGRVIIDGAHNAEATRTLAATWREELHDERLTLIFGGSTGKDALETMAPLLELSARWIFTGFASPRSVPVETLRAVWDEMTGGAPCQVAADLDTALALARESGRRILITGSLFLIGEYLAKTGVDGVYQPSQQ